MLKHLFTGTITIRNGVLLVAALVLVVAQAASAQTARDTEAVMGKTALDEYVAKQDDSYGYVHAGTQEVQGIKIHLLDMTSQTWRSETEVTPNVWRHWVTLYVPPEVAVNTGALFIGGGSFERGKPGPDATMGRLAIETKSVVVSLSLVPNQPLNFADEVSEELKERGRYEDEILSRSWRKYLETGDITWVVHLAMVKSAVRAMDAVQDFLATEAGGEIALENFVVSGGSKRGWTTWLTAAVDPRVKAIIPVVIDMLNVVPSFKHHWECYGFWAPAIQDYVDQDVMGPVFDETEAYTRLVQLIDPYAYRERLTLPKFMLNGSQDEFFLPDSAQFYWEGLQGPKHIRYVPNAGHNVSNGTDAIESLAAYYGAILYDVPLPEYGWSVVGDTLTVRAGENAPTSVRLWRATNAEARDFRVTTLEAPWEAATLVPDESGAYIAGLATPEKGWTAQFIEVKFENAPGLPPFTFTTQVYVTPDTKPFAGTQP